MIELLVHSYPCGSLMKKFHHPNQDIYKYKSFLKKKICPEETPGQIV